MTSQDTQKYIALESQWGANNYKPLEVVLTRGEGVWVWDVDGRKYLDCLSAYSAVNQGHCHPQIRETLITQAQKLTLTSRAFHNDQLPLYYQDICKLTDFERILPMNSGVEAVETAIKVVRKWGYDVKGVPSDAAEIIVCDNSFHGRTIAVVGFSTDANARTGFGPFAPGFKVIPFGDADALEAAITPRTVGFLVEPIQGEAGVIIPPEGYFKRVREICTQKNVALMLDEIQTGLGRTGRLFAADHDGVKADVALIGKSLSGGYYPISAVLATTQILGTLSPGQHGSTYGGNPLACAIARTALKVLVEEGMIENAERMGHYMLDGLSSIKSNLIKQVRGRGLMVGIEFHADAGGARKYCDALRENQILCKETHVNTVRLAPPLVISQEQVDWALERIERVVRI